MDIPIRIVYRGVARSNAIEAQVRASAQKLAAFSELIRSCRVELARADNAGRELYVVAIRIAVPGSVIELDDGIAQSDLAQALRIAFAHIRAPLDAAARRQRGNPTLARLPSHGRITQLLDGFGFIEAADGLHAKQVALAKHPVV